MLAPTLGVFGKHPQQRLARVEGSSDFEKMPELVFLRNVVVQKVSADAGQHAAKTEILQHNLDSMPAQKLNLPLHPRL